MAAKRLIGGVTPDVDPGRVLAQAQRLAFEGADELCLMSGADVSALSFSISTLVEHVELPLTVWLPRGGTDAGADCLRKGASRLVLTEPDGGDLQSLVSRLGALRLGCWLRGSGETLPLRAMDMLEVGIGELYLAMTDLAQARVVEAVTRLPMHVVGVGGGTLSTAADWMLAGGDAWLQLPGEGASIAALKATLAAGGLRVRT